MFQARKANDSATVLQIKEQFQKQIEEMLKSTQRHETNRISSPLRPTPSAAAGFKRDALSPSHNVSPSRPGGFKPEMMTAPPRPPTGLRRDGSSPSRLLPETPFRAAGHRIESSSPSRPLGYRTDTSSPSRASGHSTETPSPPSRANVHRIETNSPSRALSTTPSRLPDLQLDPPPEFGGIGISKPRIGTESNKRWGLADFSSPGLDKPASAAHDPKPWKDLSSSRAEGENIKPFNIATRYGQLGTFLSLTLLTSV